MKVRDAALLRTEKVEKQKAEVEAARDTLKCVSVMQPQGLVVNFSLTAMVMRLLTRKLLSKNNSPWIASCNERLAMLGNDATCGLLCRADVAGLKWQVEQAARNLEAERRRGEALSRERESLAKLRAQAENATHTQAWSSLPRSAM